MQILKGTTVCPFLNSKCSMFSLLFLQYRSLCLMEFYKQNVIYRDNLFFLSQIRINHVGMQCPIGISTPYNPS